MGLLNQLTYTLLNKRATRWNVNDAMLGVMLLSLFRRMSEFGAHQWFHFLQRVPLCSTGANGIGIEAEHVARTVVQCGPGVVLWC